MTGIQRFEFGDHRMHQAAAGEPKKRRQPSGRIQGETIMIYFLATSISFLKYFTAHAKKRRWRIAIAFMAGFLLIHPSTLYAQPMQLNLDRLTTQDGLSNNRITCFLQDRQGFMWIGAENGLNRYDGYTFASHYHDADDALSLSDNYITCLYEDAGGMLWIGTSQGALNRYDPQKNQFTPFLFEHYLNKKISRESVLCIAEDSRRNLWIGNYDGLFCFNREEERFLSMEDVDESLADLSNYAVSVLYPETPNKIWIGSYGGGLYAFNPQSREYKQYLHDSGDPHSILDNTIYAIQKDSAGNLWIGTTKGLDHFDPEQERFQHFLPDPSSPAGISDDVVKSILSSHAGDVWIGADFGLNRFRAAGRTFEKFYSDPLNPYGLIDAGVRALYEDRGGVIWIGTEKGINLLSPFKQNFRHYKHHPLRENSLSSDRINSIAETSDGRIWFGSDYGLNALHRETGDYQRYFVEPYDQALGGLISNWITVLYRDREGFLWMGSDRGLSRYDIESQTLNHYPRTPGLPNTLPSEWNISIHEDQKSNFWIGTGEGLVYFDREANVFTPYPTSLQNSHSISGFEINAIVEDQEGYLWIGTERGLNRLHPETKDVQQFFHKPDDSHSLRHNHVNTIFKDKNNAIWIGTRGGLSRWDAEQNSFRSFTKSDGLPSDEICAIQEDGQGVLWLSFPAEIASFDPESHAVRVHGYHEGIRIHDFRVGVSCKTGDGEIFFGGHDGVVSFHPGRIQRNHHIPPVVLTSFQTFGQEKKLTGSISNTRRIVLSYWENFFTFEFAALDFTSPSQNQYAFQMQGFNPDWVNANSHRYASYTNLDPGVYRFRVKGSNNDGVWNESGAEIDVVITPPFWMTWWFRSLAILTIAGLFLLWHILRIRRIQKEGEALRKAHHQLSIAHQELRNEMSERKRLENEILHISERERRKVGQDLHDNVCQTLKSIELMMTVMARSLSQSNPSASDNARKIAEVANQAITETYALAKGLCPVEIGEKGLLVALENLLSRFESQGSVACHLKIMKGIQIDDLMISTHIYRIVQESVANAIQHGKAKHVFVEFLPSNGSLKLTIQDDGVGLPDQKDRGEGMGLHIMQFRAQAIGALLEVQRASEGGTIVQCMFMPEKSSGS